MICDGEWGRKASRVCTFFFSLSLETFFFFFINSSFIILNYKLYTCIPIGLYVYSKPCCVGAR